MPEPVREQTAAAWDTLLQPVLDHYASRPPPARGRRRGHNLALRRAKLPMKISGGFRTRAGAERFARMRGLVETARKQGHNLLDLLRHI